MVGIPGVMSLVLLYIIYQLLIQGQNALADKIDAVSTHVSAIGKQNEAIMSQHIELRSAQERATNATISMCKIFARAFRQDEGYCDASPL